MAPWFLLCLLILYNASLLPLPTFSPPPRPFCVLISTLPPLFTNSFFPSSYPSFLPFLCHHDSYPIPCCLLYIFPSFCFFVYFSTSSYPSVLLPFLLCFRVYFSSSSFPSLNKQDPACKQWRTNTGNAS